MNTISKKIIFIFYLLIFSGRSILTAQTPILWGDLKLGRYAVGFRTEFLYDHSRTYRSAGEAGTAPSGRPIQVSLWYPAATEKNPRQIPFSEYVSLLPREDRFDDPANKNFANAKQLFKASLHRWLQQDCDEKKLDELMGTMTASIKNAPPIAGSFPCFIIAQGFSQSSLTHSILCEYLASYGYVVATSPSVGTNSREMTSDIRSAETQARDVEFIIGHLDDFPNADRTKLAVAGFSFGGNALMLVSMRNTNVDAAISFDSVIGFTGAIRLLSNSPSFDPARMQAPILHFTQSSHPAINFALIDTLTYCPRYIVRINGLTHFDFSSFGMISARIPGLVKETRPNQQKGYEAICQYTHHFLDAFLKGNPESKKFLQNLSGGIRTPGELLNVEVRQGQTAPPTIEQFTEVILTKGIPEAQAIYLKEKKRVPDYPLFKEETLNRLGYALLYDYEKIKEATAVFEWNVEGHPAFLQCL